MTTVRHAGVRDIGAVLQLWETAGAEPTVTDDSDALRTLLEFDPQSILVALEGERLIATLIIAWDGWRGSFYRLAVVPDQRRRGVARRLVAEGEAQLRRGGARRLSVFAVAGDPRAIPFWEAVGYVAQPDRQRLVKVPD